MTMKEFEPLKFGQQVVSDKIEGIELLEEYKQKMQEDGEKENGKIRHHHHHYHYHHYLIR